MDYEAWQSSIIYEPGRMDSAVYLSRRTGSGREFLKPDNTLITVKRGEPSGEDVSFAHLDHEQLTALQVALDKNGIKRPDAGFTEGKLIATERHLEDMRSIVGHIKKIPLEGNVQ